MRPLPGPLRSARKFAVNGPVITISPVVLPSPRPLSGSLLAAETIEHDGAASTTSVARASTTTFTNLWFAGHSTLGFTLSVGAEGGGVSCTITVNDPLTELLLASCAEHVTVVTPIGKTVPDSGEHVTVTGPSTASTAVGENVVALPA